MPNTDSAVTSKSHLPLHRVLEDEYVLMHGPLPRAYPWLFLLNHVKRTKCLVSKLNDRTNVVSNHVRGKLHELSSNAASGEEFGADEVALLKIIEADTKPFGAKELPSAERSRWTKALASLFNRLLEEPSLYDGKVFEGIPLPKELREMAERLTQRSEQVETRSVELAQLNRLLLEQAYPDELAKIYDTRLEHFRTEIRERLKEGDDVARVQSKLAQLKKGEQDNVYAIRLAAIHSLLHKQERYALCLSGGGVRSATFNLGILQGLARHRLLPEFDYLSTVSGGGYIGSWLSAWVYREHDGEHTVSKEMGKRTASALEPEPEPVDWLRDYSNHQTPRAGVMSADFWTLVGVYLRNLFLNWLSFIPLLMAALMLPRMGVAMIGYKHGGTQQTFLLWGGFVAAAVAAAFTAASLPSSGKLKFTSSQHMRNCIFPLVASALLFAGYWVCPTKNTPPSVGQAVGGGIAVGLIGLAAYVFVRIRRNFNPQGSSLWRSIALIAGAAVLVTLASSVTGLIGWKVLNSEAWRLITLEAGKQDERNFATFGVPALLLLYILGGTLCAGLTSRWTGEDDQEWWARSGASAFVFIVGWVAICVLVLFLPEYLFRSLAGLRKLELRGALAVATTAIGVTSGVFTLLAGFSNKTRASVQSPGGVPFVQTASKLAAPVFLGFLIVVVAALTNWVVIGFGDLNHFLGEWYGGLSLLPDWLAPTLRLPDWVFGFSFTQAPAPTDHLALLQATTMGQCLALFGLLVGLGWVMGMIVDSNKFSLHSYYGNRLKRTYLGASREDREGNKFTGFDNCDNIQMHELRPTWVQCKSFKSFKDKSPRDLDRVIERVKTHGQNDPVSWFIYDKLLSETRDLIDAHDPIGPASTQLRNAFLQELNRLVETVDFPVPEAGKQHKEIEPLVARGAEGETRVYLNRLILESAYSEEMNPYRRPKLFHVVNMALNLAWSDKLAWQERKAETFTASPLHCGNLWLGYRRSRYYGGDNGISLGTAFTVSGAAANPNMGYMLSSPLASFLMSMFNVRLGWWLGNPGPAGNRTCQRDVPRFVLGPVVQEALQLADDQKPYVYLSDGGHFENLGLYEMVLRRCNLIVVCDASTDSDYSYESLGVAIRKIRIDLGVPIEFEEFRFAPPEALGGRHCAIAKVRYSCVDEDGTDGVLVYIKPSLAGDEPRDILNYRVGNQKFPQDSIADQFFDEPQFESYRMLGSHIIESICGEEFESLNPRQFVCRAYVHWGEEKSKYDVEWIKDWLGMDYENGNHAKVAPDLEHKAATGQSQFQQRKQRREQRGDVPVVVLAPPSGNGNKKNGHGPAAPI